ncbi:translation initiation factor IF-2 [Patescibacteria group bacterium]|nr:translation initiation factor IF-2 [Patescibacteria group bacterium]MCL5797887.1 translation initiation factor IF-2 [Patescibacteria group bacterium]
MPTRTDTQSVLLRPPIVTILGHVDHGKTTLLDYIRKTSVAAREYGGITQHIGAYQTEVVLPQQDKNGKSQSKKITFIDTPGHETFSKMRSRGAKVADIAVLVIAGNDGVMPQTIESIEHIKSAGIPCLVAINKVDIPDINLDKVKKQLTKAGLKLEEYGGDIPVVPLSAKTGQGVPKLLEMILLLAELNQITDVSSQPFKAVVIESILSKNRGPVATVVVRSGQLEVGEEVVCDNQEFKIRALVDWLGKNLDEVKNGDAAEILGWKILPPVGSILIKKSESELAKNIEKDIIDAPTISLSTHAETEITLPHPPLPAVVQNTQTAIEEEKIKIIIKADTAGTLEAIMYSLPKNIVIIQSGVGNISESDILLAKTAKALIIGFHLKPNDNILKLADSEKVIIKTYNIIYELIDEIDDVVDALKKGNLVKILGEARVQVIFDIKDQKIAGVKVISGRIAKGDQIKVVRGENEIGRAKIKSLKHNKEDITKSEQGNEAGVLLSQNLDILTGDSIISIG